MTTATPPAVEAAEPTAGSYRVGTLAHDLAAARDVLGAIPKTGYNTYDDYAYHTAEDLSRGVARALEGRGIALVGRILPETLTINSVTKEKGGREVHCWAVWEFEFSNGVESWSGSDAGYGVDRSDKCIAKAKVAALKQFLAHNFLIGTNDDNEATDEQGRSTAPAPAAASSPTPAADEHAAQAAPAGNAHAPGAGNGFELKFGKHKGKRITDGRVEDDYLSWLLENSFDPDDEKYGEVNRRSRLAIEAELDRRRKDSGHATPDDDIPF